MNSIPVQSIVVREPASLPGNEGPGAKTTCHYSASVDPSSEGLNDITTVEGAALPQLLSFTLDGNHR